MIFLIKSIARVSIFRPITPQKSLMLRYTLIGFKGSPCFNVLSNKQITQIKYYHSTTVLKSSVSTSLSTWTKLHIVSIDP